MLHVLKCRQYARLAQHFDQQLCSQQVASEAERRKANEDLNSFRNSSQVRQKLPLSSHWLKVAKTGSSKSENDEICFFPSYKMLVWMGTQIDNIFQIALNTDH